MIRLAVYFVLLIIGIILINNHFCEIDVQMNSSSEMLAKGYGDMVGAMRRAKVNAAVDDYEYQQWLKKMNEPVK